MSDASYRAFKKACYTLRAAGIHRGVWHLAQSQFNSVEAIANASDADLLALSSIGPKVLADIRAVVPNTSAMAQRCTHCGGTGLEP
jgi:ERCC4-type nuclease